LTINLLTLGALKYEGFWDRVIDLRTEAGSSEKENPVDTLWNCGLAADRTFRKI